MALITRHARATRFVKNVVMIGKKKKSRPRSFASCVTKISKRSYGGTKKRGVHWKTYWTE